MDDPMADIDPPIAALAAGDAFDVIGAAGDPQTYGGGRWR